MNLEEVCVIGHGERELRKGVKREAKAWQDLSISAQGGDRSLVQCVFQSQDGKGERFERNLMGKRMGEKLGAKARAQSFRGGDSEEPTREGGRSAPVGRGLEAAALPQAL